MNGEQERIRKVINERESLARKLKRNLILKKILQKCKKKIQPWSKGYLKSEWQLNTRIY